jgi:O-antigen/teichoic acid export membrane protein
MLKHKSDNNASYQRLAEAITLLGTTIFLAAAIASDPGITLVMGEHWSPATSLIVIFCFAAALMPSVAIFPTMLRATGRTSWMVAGALARLALTAAMLIYATHANWNTEALALAFVTLGIAMMIPNALLANHCGRMSNIGYLLAFLRGSLPAAIPAAAILLLDHIDFFDAISRSPIIELSAKLLLFITFWLVLALFFSRRLLHHIRIRRTS